MVKIPEFDKNEVIQIRNYVDKLMSEMPEAGEDFEIIIPLSLALLKNAEEAAELNKRLLWLTAILALLTLVLIVLTLILVSMNFRGF